MLDSWPAPLRRILLRLLGVRWSERELERAWREAGGDLHGMLDWIFRRNGFELRTEGAEVLDRVPGCLIAGNHPHGLFDGLALAWLASSGGRPTRVMARDFLQVFGPLQELFLSVRLDGQRQAGVGSRGVWRAALDCLRQGSRLVITPAAGLSRAVPFWGHAVDPPWRSGVVRLARQVGCPIVLVHVGMADSPLRQMLHRIHPVLRALVQLWAYRFGRRQRITLTVRAVIRPSDLPTDMDVSSQAEWLQWKLESPVMPSREPVAGGTSTRPATDR
ncbi:MAG: 1-acyl-sn-glycerol-3-phosphate acyltransferase [Pseudomonadota bacterium]